MHRRLLAVVLLAGATAACSSSGSEDSAAAPASTNAGPIGDVKNEACDINLRTLEVATEAWYAMNGTATAPTEAQLVTDGVLRSDVPGYDLVDGAIVATPGGSCA
jgi:hypothetical protein